ncbi:MAG: hypothetical protein WA532_11805, partial [Candidatus Korobacteraceae bacterium]
AVPLLVCFSSGSLPRFPTRMTLLTLFAMDLPLSLSLSPRRRGRSQYLQVSSDVGHIVLQMAVHFCRTKKAEKQGWLPFRWVAH